MSGKISSLPQTIREQLNRRLDDHLPPRRILSWLNSIPEVLTILAADFQGQPVTKQNLYQWTQNGFRDWKMRQNALEFASLDLPLPAPATDPNAPPMSSLTDKLVHWLELRFAVTARTLTPTDQDPDADLRRLRSFAADVVALRRGNLYSRRVDLEQQRLQLLAASAKEKREEEFWEWTKRPDIRNKLERRRQRNTLWYQYIRDTMPDLARYLPQDEPDETDPGDEQADPAVLI